MTPYIVVDAAIAGAWLFSEVFSLAAQPVLSALRSRTIIGLAPDRFEEELLRICQKKTASTSHGGAELAPADCFERFAELITSDISLHLVPARELHERAWEMATATAKLTTHDALYLALAERWGAELWTTDEDLASANARAIYRDVHDLRYEPFAY